ncbi:Leo1-like protein-domain-containing protein [Podospora aff. communis PSN243]|uniref:Leo1-like protein-domain-containing protein n=1 Tax=Podospora aff. communis PSN243 TaxID=3040156 RepID=A0AAV9GI04_9PEZI|nr:Leo1-like protein-domain-containing protein [Podospora aff. communis PSN243]
MTDSEEPVDAVDDLGDDLFGDADGGDAISEIENGLSDRELASDAEDDARRRETRRDTEEPTEYKEKLVGEVPLYRHRIPKSNEGGLCSLKVPDFLKLNPVEYKADSWEPSSWDLHNSKSDNPVPVVMSRRNAKTGQLQSNANVYRWSDGSVTLAVGDEHFEIQTKSLASKPGKPYQEVQDAHYYAAAAHLTTNSLLIVGHFTEQYSIRPNKEIQDHALERLKANLAEGKKERGDMIIAVTNEDPTLQQKQAELAEKERLKLQRRRETAAARAADGAGARYKGGALSIGDLEGRRAAPGGRKRGAPGGPKKKHRRPEYDSDDDLPSGARRPDNYDMDDGFLVDSDEESEEVEDDEEEELLDDDEDEAPRSKKRRTAGNDEDEDAEADMDDDDAPAPVRRRRQIIDDDDEE